MSNYFQTGWENIFQELNVVETIKRNGYFDISADDIKKISRREPRLMTKIDFRKSLPEVMQTHKLSILAIENGLYRIAPSDPFIDIPEMKNKESVVKVPIGYVSINPFDITSESMAMDIAKISGMLEKVFGESAELTIRGRLRKGANFQIILDDVHYPVNGVQIEVDGGYEGKTRLNLIEAKIGNVSNISMRQLVYPEMAWKNLIGDKKQIHSYIFSYENPFFRFIPIIFSQGKWLADGAREQVFKFEEPRKFDIFGIAPQKKAQLDYSSPFPQADSFYKVLIMLRLIGNEEHTITKPDLEEKMVDYDLHTSRQIDYYSNCLKMFRLISIERGVIEITQYGSDILRLDTKEQAYQLAKVLFVDSIFYKALHQGMDSLNQCDFEENWGILSDSTFHRRKQTIKKWIAWFQDMFT